MKSFHLLLLGFSLTHLPSINANVADSITYLVLDEKTKKPINEVDVNHFYKDNPIPITNAGTDKFGIVKIKYEDNLIGLEFTHSEYESRKITPEGSLKGNTPPFEIYLSRNEGGQKSNTNNDNPPPRSSFFINFEEDFLAFFDNQDRNYTGGISLDFFKNTETEVTKLTVGNFDNLIGYFGKPFGIIPHNNYVPLSSGVSIGVTGFTPDSLNTTTILPNDRPYSSLIFLNFVKNTVPKNFKGLEGNSTSLATSEFMLGFLGLHVYHQLQSGIHEVNRLGNQEDTPHDPEGWNNQISNGGEPTFAYVYSKKIQGADKAVFGKDKKFSDLRFQFAYSYRLSMGYITGMSAELQTRLGLIRSNIIFFNNNKFGGSALQGKKIKGFEFFPFASLRVISTVYNSKLSGQFKKSVHSFKPISETNLFMVEWDYGLGINFSKRFGTYLFFRHRTPEVRKITGYPQRIHSWGGIYLNWYFD